MTLRVLLVLAAVVCGVVATLAGFGFWDSRDVAQDYPGWVALSATFFAASFIPWDRYER